MYHKRKLFDDSVRNWLLVLARDSLTAATGGILPPEPVDIPEPALSPGGCFVTLHSEDKLRGCIGILESESPLWKNVSRMAAEAALRDPRFPPVPPAELETIRIEISCLTPTTPLKDPLTLNLGVDGLILNFQGRRAVFLPQVATEQGWDHQTLLEQLCIKAGLPPGTWREQDVRFLTFNAEIFSEED